MQNIFFRHCDTLRYFVFSDASPHCQRCLSTRLRFYHLPASSLGTSLHLCHGVSSESQRECTRTHTHTTHATPAGSPLIAFKFPHWSLCPSDKSQAILILQHHQTSAQLAFCNPSLFECCTAVFCPAACSLFFLLVLCWQALLVVKLCENKPQSNKRSSRWINSPIFKWSMFTEWEISLLWCH